MREYLLTMPSSSSASQGWVQWPRACYMTIMEEVVLWLSWLVRGQMVRNGLRMLQAHRKLGYPDLAPRLRRLL